MSGSGGGGGGGGGGGEETINCSTLRYKTTLNSPVAAVIATLRPKDVLTLQQLKDDGPLHALSKGKSAGTIAGSLLVRLLKCMNDGFEYEAVVLKVSGGNVEVEIRLKGA